MSLKKDQKWRQTKPAATLDQWRFRGTAFTWFTTLLMTIQMLPTTLPAFALLGFSLPQTFAVLLPGMLVHALVWNMIHPPMHGLPDVPASVGAPSWVLGFLRKTPYVRWIYKNHQGHHVLGGQCNYNVCCPLADHILGTYVPATEWSKKMRAVPGPDATERWGTPIEPAGVPQAPIIAEGMATEEDLTPTALKVVR
jgi:sterol desaturase/sphingolipid hydroxylase (fatty acid hydroxylase superfamily)